MLMHSRVIFFLFFFVLYVKILGQNPRKSHRLYLKYVTLWEICRSAEKHMDTNVSFSLCWHGLHYMHAMHEVIWTRRRPFCVARSFVVLSC